MDIVHHKMIGGVGFSFLAANNHEIAGAASKIVIPSLASTNFFSVNR